MVVALCDDMQGNSHPIWIIAAVLIVLLIIYLLIAPLIRGQKVLGIVVTETDFRNCCSNYCAEQSHNIYIVQCSVPKEADDNGDGKMLLATLCKKIGRDPINKPEQCKPCTCE